MNPALVICPFLFVCAVADEPPVVAEGRTWVWSEALRMYRPAGLGWNWSADREVWWREKPQEKPAVAPAPRWRPPGDGWSWDAESGHWWRYAPQPVPRPLMLPAPPSAGNC